MIFADEATHWDALDMHYKTGRINHSEMYSECNGKHTNGVDGTNGKNESDVYLFCGIPGRRRGMTVTKEMVQALERT